jgi:hypothetical protein
MSRAINRTNPDKQNVKKIFLEKFIDKKNPCCYTAFQDGSMKIKPFAVYLYTRYACVRMRKGDLSPILRNTTWQVNSAINRSHDED